LSVLLFFVFYFFLFICRNIKHNGHNTCTATATATVTVTVRDMIWYVWKEEWPNDFKASDSQTEWYCVFQTSYL